MSRETWRDPSARALVDRLVGVIDLSDGHAVHAVAGQRNAYREVGFCGGNPSELAAHYGSLGVSNLYLADLDAIGGALPQHDTIATVAQYSTTTGLMLDVGITGAVSPRHRDCLRLLAADCPSIRWVVATETCQSLDTLGRLVDQLGPDRVVLSLDYRAGILQSFGPSEREWIAAALEHACCGVIVLDISQVGTAAGPVTGPACQRVRQMSSSVTIHSGGGIRSLKDVESLRIAGCDQFLVATMLYP